jgi:hypothetical protein
LNDFVVQNYSSNCGFTSFLLTHTADWLFKLCSCEVAEIVEHILSCSFAGGVVPDQWLTAVVTPVPKVYYPSSLNYFRPISVTPILSI